MYLKARFGSFLTLKISKSRQGHPKTFIDPKSFIDKNVIYTDLKRLKALLNVSVNVCTNKNMLLQDHFLAKWFLSFVKGYCLLVVCSRLSPYRAVQRLLVGKATNKKKKKTRLTTDIYTYKHTWWYWLILGASLGTMARITKMETWQNESISTQTFRFGTVILVIFLLLRDLFIVVGRHLYNSHKGLRCGRDRIPNDGGGLENYIRFALGWRPNYGDPWLSTKISRQKM